MNLSFLSGLKSRMLVLVGTADCIGLLLVIGVISSRAPLATALSAGKFFT